MATTIFEPIVLKFKGQTYRLEPSATLRAIAIVEEYVTLHELGMKYDERKTAPTAKMAMAYAAVLRFLGAGVTDEEVYSAMFAVGTRDEVSLAIFNLLLMMVPPSIRNRMPDLDTLRTTPVGNAVGAKAPLSKAGGKLSRKRTRVSSSDPDGLPLPSSGDFTP